MQFAESVPVVGFHIKTHTKSRQRGQRGGENKKSSAASVILSDRRGYLPRYGCQVLPEPLSPPVFLRENVVSLPATGLLVLQVMTRASTVQPAIGAVSETAVRETAWPIAIQKTVEPAIAKSRKPVQRGG
jgi:hypothetical protein